MPGTITSVNAAISIAVAGVFSAPQQLQQFSADDIFDSDPIEPAEVQMGVDGVMSAGFVFVGTPFNVTLQANSPSADLFETWMAAQRSQRDILYGNGNVRLTGIGKVYTLTKIVLFRYPQMPSAKRVLQPRTFGMMVESVTAAPA